MRLLLSVYVYQVVWRNLLIFGHNLLIVLVVVLVFAIWPGWIALLAVPAIVILCLNGVWVGMLLGLISARRIAARRAVLPLKILVWIASRIWLAAIYCFLHCGSTPRNC